MTNLSFSDLIAGLVTLALTLGVVALALLGRDIPQGLTGPLGLAFGWLFRGGLAAANSAHQNRRRTPDA